MRVPAVTSRPPDGNAVAVLDALGVDRPGLQERLERAVAAAPWATGPPGVPDGAVLPSPVDGLSPTPRYHRIHAAAHQTALARGHRHLGVEHLMLAILDDASSVATGAILATGTSLEDVSRALEGALARYGPGARSGRRAAG